MKSYNGLFVKMTEIEEIKASINEAAKKRRKRSYVQRVLNDIDGYSYRLRDKIISGEWQPLQHKECVLREGYHKKERNILKPSWNNEQIVHHMLTRQLIPIIRPRLYKYACGSVKGRGSHYLLKAAKSWVKGYGNKRFYVAELDIRKFYDNVDLDILRAQIDRLIRDKQYKRELYKVIGTGEKGLPKGYYTSPWLAHLYLLSSDNYITQVLQPDHYARYMDNMWLFSTNKRDLHRQVEALNDFLKNNLRVELKNDWQVFRFEGAKDGKGRAVNMLGFVVHRHRVGIRKGIIKRIRAKANRVHRKGHTTRKDAASILSRLGFFRYANAHRYFVRYIKTMVSIRYLKRIVRKFMKRGMQHDKLGQSHGRCVPAGG